MVVITVIRVKHKLHTGEMERGKIGVSIADRRAQDVAVKREGGWNVAYQQIHGEPGQRAAILVCGHPRLAHSFLCHLAVSRNCPVVQRI